MKLTLLISTLGVKKSFAIRAIYIVNMAVANKQNQLILKL